MPIRKCVLKLRAIDRAGCWSAGRVEVKVAGEYNHGIRVISPGVSVCRGFDFLGELLTTCVAIAPDLVPRSFCEHVEVKTLNETCQSRTSSDHLPHEPQASTPRERITFRSAKALTRPSIR